MSFSRSRLTHLAALLALVSAVGPARALVPPAEDVRRYEKLIPTFDPYQYQDARTAAGATLATQSFGLRHGGEWRTYGVNPLSNTPRHLYGSGVQVTDQAFREANDVVTAARGVIGANPEVFGATNRDLRFSAAPRGLGKWAAQFQQTHGGVDVWGGRANLVFTDAGRLFAMGSNYYPGIDIDAKASVLASVAEVIARDDLPFYGLGETDRIDEKAKLLVLPIQSSDTEVSYHLVWKVIVVTGDPVGRWVTHVDAHTGEIIARFNDVHFLDYSGTASGVIEPDTYCNPTEIQDFGHLRVTVQGLPAATSNADGDWAIPYLGLDQRVLSADLFGPWVDLNNIQGNEAQFNGVAIPGIPASVHFDDTNSRADERDVFNAIGDVHDFIAIFDPTFGYINQRITANVNRSQTCNAYWDGTINFYQAGGGCGNTGQIQGVAHHEFGHGVQNFILGGQGNQGLGEGNGDILSNLLTQESIIGRGFNLNQCAAGIRDSENTLQYPGDVEGQGIHAAGRVIAGFNWDAMQGLQAVHGVEQGTILSGARWHFGRVLLEPNFQPDQVFATFVADDDNGNLDDGTPNHDAICEAALNHGFECPEILIGVIIAHTPLQTSTTPGDRLVSATIYSTAGAMDSDSVQVTYRINGGPFVDVVMAPGGGIDEWETTIAGLVQGSEVEYYIRGVDEVGNSKNNPPLAPAAFHSFDVATVFDTIEVESGWTVNAEGGDNATTGTWTRVDPNGTSAQPEDDHTITPGVICWVTGDAPAGQGVGTNDVDGGTTTLYSPIYDMSGATKAKAKYYRWYSNNQGDNANQDPWIVQVRNNGGAWTEVENTTATLHEWSLRSVDVLDLYGGALGNVQLRFIAQDTAGGSIVEAGVDDFEILVDLGSADVSDSPASQVRFALHPARPNPATSGAAIGFEVPARTRVDLRIYDITGREIRSIAERSYDAGAHQLQWDGRDARGRQVASGVYYIRLSAEGYQANRPVVIER